MSKRKTFSDEEKELLVQFVQENSSILENKSNDARIMRNKKQLWIKLSQLFASNGYERDWQRLRECYQRLKCTAKTNIYKFKKGMKATGGGTNSEEPTEIDWVIQGISPLDFEKDENPFDSDQNRLQIREMESMLVDPVTGSLIPESTSMEFVSLEPENEPMLDPELEPQPTTSQPKSKTVSKKKSKKTREMSAYEDEMLKLNRRLLLQRVRDEHAMHNALLRHARQDNLRKARTHKLQQQKLKLEILYLRKTHKKN